VRVLSRAVTVALILIVGGGAIWLFASRVARPTVGQGFRTFAMFRDGSGLPVGSQVVIAGVQVGEIDGLSIQDGLARVSMRLRDDVVIWDDAYAAKRASSLLGDSYIEILPGGPLDDDPASLERRRLASGQGIPRVLEGGSTERVLRSVSNAMPRIDSAMKRAHAILLDARRVVSGPVTDGFTTADEWLTTGAIAGPIESMAGGAARLQAWTVDLADSTAGLAQRVNPAVEGFADDLDGATKSITTAHVSIRDTLMTARTRMDDIDPYIARANAALEEYTGVVAVDQQGTLSRLIHDDELGERISDATDGVKGFTDSLNRGLSWMGLRAEYNVLSGKPQLYVVAEVQTREDKFYVIEVQKGPQGGLPRSSLTDQPGSDIWTIRTKIKESVKFTLQWGKRIGFARFRFGFKESTFGAGADADFIDRRLRLSADVYEASFARAPRLKLAASFAIFKYIYVVAGIDDALNPGGTLPIAPWPAGMDEPNYFKEVRYGRDYFVGGMLNITDADLATMLRVYGALLLAGLAPSP
jgi:phospholipid/cholesterol/gamma-HCH transport system substrate-binding protein